jgi:predicted transcriptional regulator
MATNPTTIRLRADEKRLLKQLTKLKGLSATDVIRQAIREYAAKQQKRTA